MGVRGGNLLKERKLNLRLREGGGTLLKRRKQTLGIGRGVSRQEGIIEMEEINSPPTPSLTSQVLN